MNGMGLLSLRRALRAGRAKAAVWFVLAAFVFQYAATHAHFHFTPSHDGSIAVASDASSPGKPAKAPLHDQANCPLFHAAGVCGAALAGAPPAPILVETGAARVVFIPAAPRVERIAANWRSRAPPSL